VSDARLHHLEDHLAAFEENDTVPANCQIQLDTERSWDTNLGAVFTGLAHHLDCLERGWSASANMP
jgi:hypothetical protein